MGEQQLTNAVISIQYCLQLHIWMFRYVENSCYNSLASILSTDSKTDTEDFYAMFANDGRDQHTWNTSQVSLNYILTVCLSSSTCTNLTYCITVLTEPKKFVCGSSYGLKYLTGSYLKTCHGKDSLGAKIETSFQVFFRPVSRTVKIKTDFYFRISIVKNSIYIRLCKTDV
jgi:hypothetical protein